MKGAGILADAVAHQHRYETRSEIFKGLDAGIQEIYIDSNVAPHPN